LDSIQYIDNNSIKEKNRILKFDDGQPYSIAIIGQQRLFRLFIAQITTEAYYNEILEKVQEIVSGKISQYIFEHNDVYLTLQKDIISTRVE
jgi:hypothetical protein